MNTVVSQQNLGNNLQNYFSPQLTPILFGAAAFQYLNAGCELGLFELLHNNNLTKDTIANTLKLELRAVDTLLLGTTALNLTETKKGCYQNSILIENLLNNGLWKMFKDVVAFEQHIVYLPQAEFVNSLRENKNIGLKYVDGEGKNLYERLKENPFLEKVFYNYMESWSKLANGYLLEQLDFSKIYKILDVGGGTGVNALALARAYPHLEITILEIPNTVEITQHHIDKAGLSSRVKVQSGDIFKTKYPKDHDCILFSHQLVIWTPEENILLLSRAYEALNNGGKVIIFNSVSDNKGTGPLMAALDSVYFTVLPEEGGMIYCWDQYQNWLEKVGFKKIHKINCYAWTPHGIIQAVK